MGSSQKLKGAASLSRQPFFCFFFKSLAIKLNPKKNELYLAILNHAL
jgi:hypothetical protein